MPAKTSIKNKKNPKKPRAPKQMFDNWSKVVVITSTKPNLRPPAVKKSPTLILVALPNPLVETSPAVKPRPSHASETSPPTETSPSVEIIQFATPAETNPPAETSLSETSPPAETSISNEIEKLKAEIREQSAEISNLKAEMQIFLAMTKANDEKIAKLTEEIAQFTQKQEAVVHFRSTTSRPSPNLLKPATSLSSMASTDSMFKSQEGVKDSSSPGIIIPGTPKKESSAISTKNSLLKIEEAGPNSTVNPDTLKPDSKMTSTAVSTLNIQEDASSNGVVRPERLKPDSRTVSTDSLTLKVQEGSEDLSSKSIVKPGPTSILPDKIKPKLTGKAQQEYLRQLVALNVQHKKKAYLDSCASKEKKKKRRDVKFEKARGSEMREKV